MAKTLQQILGFENLTGLIQDPRGGVPADLIPAGFMEVRQAKQVAGNTSKYIRVDGSRHTARLVQYGSASVKRQLRGTSEVPTVLMHTYEHINHEMHTLTALRQVDNPQLQARGQQEVDRQTAEFRRTLNNLRVSSVFSALRHGAIHFDADGNLLPSATGVATTVDFQVPAGNKNQLDVDGTGDIIDASWATDGTNIIAQMLSLRKAARKLTGYPLTTAFYGENILEYLLSNTVLKEFLNRNPRMQEALIGGDIPDGLFKLNWRPAYEAFFQDNADVNQDWWGGDTIVFTPEPSPDWWEWQLGSYEVPTSVGNIGADGLATLADFRTVMGMFSYAKVTDDPPGIKHYYGDTFLPTMKVPKAVFIADVTP